MAAFALVTTVGHQPRAARSTPSEPGRAADRQAFASLSYLTHRQVLRNAAVLPKKVGTIPTYTSRPAGMRRFHESRIVLQLSGRKQAVILIVTSRKEEDT